MKILIITKLARKQSLIRLLLIRKILDTHVLPGVSVLAESIMCPSLRLLISEPIQSADDESWRRALWRRRPKYLESCTAAETEAGGEAFGRLGIDA
jgi:hypothetical protein